MSAANAKVDSTANKKSSKPTESVETVVIRFAGDSGDGMQLTGDRFTSEAALFGNDLRTFPDYPAEIRAPAGTLAGVSAFQVCFASQNIHTPGDALDVLVAMNPAALRMSLKDLKVGGKLIINTAQFKGKNLEMAGYKASPVEDGSLDKYTVFPVDITKITTEALDELNMNSRAVDRCKNFFALGLCLWMYSRDLEHTIDWIKKKFGKSAELVEANVRALKAGYFYGETAEIFTERYEVKPARIAPGIYRNINGNKAAALGLITAAKKAGRDLFLGSYPITPASDILHELSAYKHYGVYTFQAEDEIAAIASAIGASFGGALAVTTTSGPGLALKGEAIGLALMVELPLVIVDVQRGGPSTGLPTKTEQADLFQAVFGRNSEAPVPVLAAASPSDCFDAAIEASRLALKYMTPVILLTDGAIANCAEPWRIPDPETIPALQTREITEASPSSPFRPYKRDKQTLARPWARLGTPGLEHRIGGLEKEHISGGVSYDGDNHEFMVRLRDAKVKRVAQDIPPSKILGESSGDLLVIGWGSTQGVIQAAVEKLQLAGKRVSALHLRHLNPLPPDLEGIMKRFKQVACAEMNLGQLATVLRAQMLIDVKKICKVQGQPFKQEELMRKMTEILEGKYTSPFVAESLEYLTGEAKTQRPVAAQFARYE